MVPEFWTACLNGNGDAVRQFLAEGVDVDTVFQGFPVLCVAAQNGHEAIVEQLLSAGASVDQPNRAAPRRCSPRRRKGTAPWLKS